jgi:hypothetical protein
VQSVDGSGQAGQVELVRLGPAGVVPLQVDNPTLGALEG